MKRTTKLCRALLIVVLTTLACQLTATAPTASPPTATPQPTTTPLPTDTLAPTPTNTPEPPTATPVTPTATFTPTPGPGDIIFTANFAELKEKWLDFAFNFETGEDTTKYTIEAQDQRLYIEVPEKTTSVYAIYDHNFKADVQIDVEVTTVTGPNRNNISVVCRSNDKGWYEFSIHSGGLWVIYKFEYETGFVGLVDGGSEAINLRKATNHMTIVCQGNTLAFYINDSKLGQVDDTEFARGRVGVSASTFNISGVGVAFENFEVRIPDRAHSVDGN